MEAWIARLGLSKSVSNARLAVQPLYSLSAAFKENKPYFGRRLAAFQSPPVRYALIDAAVREWFAGKRSARVLEIGSWAGASAITFGLALRQLGLTDSVIVCVDHWERYLKEEGGHYESMNSAADSGEIQRLFRHNVQACGLAQAVQVKQGRSREVLPLLEAQSFDLVYVDGSHKREEVLFDIEQAKRLVRDGGFICGDDLELPKSQVDPVNHELAVREGTDFVTDPCSGVRYHPGVTEAVAEAFDAVLQEHGVWFVQRAGSQFIQPRVPTQAMELPPHLLHAVEIPFGIYGGYELFQLGETYVAYPLSGTDWFQRRLAQSSLEELVLLIDSIEETSRARGKRLIETRHGYDILSARGEIWAIAQRAGEVDVSDAERVRQLLVQKDLFRGASIEDARAWVDQMAFPGCGLDGPSSTEGTEGIDPGRVDRIIETVHGYNILSARGRIWAIAQRAGAVDVSDEARVRQLQVQKDLFQGQTVEEARAWVNEIVLQELHQHPPGSLSSLEETNHGQADHIIEARHGYNILGARGKIWAIAQRAGEVDVSDEERVRQLQSQQDLFEGQTVEDARAWVDKVILQ